MEAIDTIIPRASKVYITNFIYNHDYSSANQFGEQINITVGSVNLRELGRVVTDVAIVIEKSHFNDYLLLSGINQISVIAAILWFHLHDVVKLLCWDKKLNSYKLLELNEKEVVTLFEKII